MYKFEVNVRGPDGHSTSGLYNTVFITNAHELADRLIENLANDGYIQLSGTGDRCIVIFKESITSFSVKPVKEEEE